MCKGSGERAIGGVEMVEGKELSLEQTDVVGCFKGGTHGCIGMGCGSSLPPVACAHKPCCVVNSVKQFSAFSVVIVMNALYMNDVENLCNYRDM